MVHLQGGYIMRVCVYTRVSTDEQAESLENQKIYFDDYLKKHTEYKPFRDDYVFSDLGLSGTMLNNRPAFFEMLYCAGIDVNEVLVPSKIENGNQDKRKKRFHTVFTVSERPPMFDLILLKNTSRFARNTLSFGIISDLRAKGVAVYFIEQDINTAQITSDFLLKLFQLFDEQDSRDKSIKVKTGIQASNLKNTIRTTSKIYGYKYHKEDNSLEIIPHEAEVIKKIYSLYIEGFGIRQIINKLDAENIKTRDNKPFCKSSIRRILTNEKYKGCNALSKYTNGDVFNRYTYPHIVEGYKVVDNDRIPPIVRSEDFEAVQEMLKGKVNHQKNNGKYNGISKYSGKVHCADCGAVFYSNRDRGRIFYVCSNKKQHGLNICNNSNISESALDAFFLECYNNQEKILAEEKAFQRYMLLNIANKLREDFDYADIQEQTKLEEEIKELKTKIDKLIELFLLSPVNETIIKSQMDALGSELKEKQGKLEELSKPNKEKIAEIRYYVDKAKYIKDKFSVHFDEEEFFDIFSVVVDNGHLELDISQHYWVANKKDRMEWLLLFRFPGNDDYSNVADELEERCTAFLEMI